MDHAGTSRQCRLSPTPSPSPSLSPTPSLSHGPGPVSNKSEVWKNEGWVASKVRFERKNYYLHSALISTQGYHIILFDHYVIHLYMLLVF